MRKRRRCNLCGAKLEGDICKECGYNNAAYDYKVNQSIDSCRHSSSEKYYDKEDHETHSSGENIKFDYSENWQENTERWADFSEKYSGAESSGDTGYSASDPKPGKDTVTYGLNENRKDRKKKKTKPGWITIFIVACAVCVTGISKEVLDELHSVKVSYFDDIWVSEDDFEEVSEEERPAEEAAEKKQPSAKLILAAGEKSFQETYGPGLYVAGIHFPAGTYDAEWIGGSGSLFCWNQSRNYWDGDYLYEDEGTVHQGMEGLELKAGTLLSVGSTLQISLSTSEADGYLAQLPRGEKGETVTLDEVNIVGQTLKAGTYRVRASMVSGEVESQLLYTYIAGSDTKRSAVIDFREECDIYENLILRDGDVLIPMNCEITLIPADYDLNEYADQLF